MGKKQGSRSLRYQKRSGPLVRSVSPEKPRPGTPTSPEERAKREYAKKVREGLQKVAEACRDRAYFPIYGWTNADNTEHFFAKFPNFFHACTLAEIDLMESIIVDLPRMNKEAVQLVRADLADMREDVCDQYEDMKRPDFEPTAEKLDILEKRKTVLQNYLLFSPDRVCDELSQIEFVLFMNKKK
jgi:hypothetical protein